MHILHRKLFLCTLLSVSATRYQSQDRSMQDRLHLPGDRSLYICSRTQQYHLIPGIHVRILPEYRTVSYFLLSVLHRTIFRMSHCHFSSLQQHQIQNLLRLVPVCPVEILSGNVILLKLLLLSMTDCPEQTAL